MPRWLPLLLPLLLGCAAAERAQVPEAGAPTGTSVSALLAALEGPEREARIDAAQELGRRKAPDAIEPLADAVLGRTRDLDELWRYVEALRELGPPATEVLARILRDDRDELFPELSELDEPSPNDELRQEAALSLWVKACGDELSARAVAPVLAEALADPAVRANVRLFCLRGLEQGRAPVSVVEPALAVALGDEDLEPTVREQATVALAQIATPHGAGVGALARALGDRSPRVRLAAARALLALGVRARSARPALQEASHDPDPLVARTSSRALRGLGAAPLDPPGE
jgi:hypothetical protein